jgi:hypothetical protein
LKIKDQVNLQNGFRYVKELLLQIHNYKIYSDYHKLLSAGVDVFSVKTDAFTIKQDDITVAEQVLKFSKDIGGWRLSKEEGIKLPTVQYSMVENRQIIVDALPFERINITDEWDVKEICKVFEEKKRVMVRANLPGSGKSYACEYMQSLGHKVLFVCPTNKLTQKYGNDGVTLNKFFGLSVSDEERLTKFDFGNYDTIIFDEIYFSSIQKLAKIKQFCDNNPDIIVIATGDTAQLPPITDYTNTKNIRNMLMNVLITFFHMKYF